MNTIYNLYRKQDTRILGLMSGTSLDGLDIADISFQSKGVDFYFNNYQLFPFSKKQRMCILQSFQGNAKMICQLNYDLGNFFADCILQYLKQHKLKTEMFDLIASHGQTIYHLGGNSTLQLGEADLIAYKTKIPVIFDFRAVDIVTGSQGAPLIPYFDQYLQKKLKKPTLFINLGGIANFTYVNENEIVFSDTGPANILLNLLVRIKTNGEYYCDKNNIFSKNGKVVSTVLDDLLKHPFLMQVIPKSCGHEEFGEKFLKQTIKNYPTVSFADLLTTLTTFSSKTIVQVCEKYLKDKDSLIVVSGGGVHNKLLMKNLKKDFMPFKINKIEELFTFGSDAKESVAFAYFANEKFNNVKWKPLAKKSFGKIAFPF